VVGQVEVLSVALIDGQVAPLTLVDLTPSAAGGATTNASCALEFVFPPFTSSVVYDPSLGVGVLLGRSSTADGGGGDDGSSSDHMALIVGVAVAVPVAVALVAAVVVVALVVTRWRMLRAVKTNSRASVNFDESVL
jgi:hypothetical protein